MTRLRYLLAPAMAIVFVLGLQTYAQAALYKDGCKTVLADDSVTDKVCAGVDYHRIAGKPGISVDRLTISYLGADFQSADCYSLKLVNDNGVITWLKQGNLCDIGTYPTYRGFVPQQDMPQSVTADLVWYGNANLNNWPDKDFTLTVHLTQ